LDDEFRCHECGAFDSYGTITDGLCGYCKEKLGGNMDQENTQTVCQQLEEVGYDHAVAVATQAEIEAGAACGQLSIITEEEEK
jgi:hypothetical protein